MYVVIESFAFALLATSRSEGPVKEQLDYPMDVESNKTDSGRLSRLTDSSSVTGPKRPSKVVEEVG